MRQRIVVGVVSWLGTGWLGIVVALGAQLGGQLGAQVPVAPPASTPAPAPAAVAAPVANGRLEQHGALRLLRLWGTPQQRGYAHGRLLATEFAAVALPEFTTRFARQQPLLQQARAAVGRLIEYPEDVQQELDGLWQGLVDSKVDLQMPELERAFDRTDLLVANALDVFGLMGCSSFTVWGAQVEGGGVLTARNFDWPLTGDHMLTHTMLIVQHFADGHAVASVGWPGYVGTVTGVSNDGVAAFLHVGTGTVTWTPEPSSWPTAIAARCILAHGVGTGDAAATFAFAKEQLGYTSPPAGYLTHVVLPKVPAQGPPLGLFEADSKSVQQGDAGQGPFVLTNHFLTRKDGRGASTDSLDREKKLDAGIAGCMTTGDQVMSVGEAWTALQSVQRGGKRAFGTLHALVFRHEPWCFELRIAEHGDKGIVAAPISGRQYVLTRAQVFADGEVLGR